MIQYYFLNKLLQQVEPSSITVDIFDTVLLRKWQPEPWRFYCLAKPMSEAINKAGLKSTTYQVYSARQNFSKLLRMANLENGKDHETTHSAIMNSIVDDLARQQKTRLSKAVQLKLATKLKDIELQYEINQLKPNKPLLKVLNQAKINSSKIYFVSDMYLETEELNQLMKSKKIKLFSGGISSADTLLGKSSGRSFLELARKYPNISLISSIHIGDNMRSDFRVPKQIGLKAYYLYLPLHRLYLWAGKYIFGAILKYDTSKKRRHQKNMLSQKMKQQFSNKQMSTELEAQYIGWLFGPAIIHYLHRLGTTSSMQNKQVVFVSSESIIFTQLYKKLGYDNAKILPKLNRSKLIRAYSAILFKKDIKLYSIIPFVKKVLRRKNTRNALAVLNITRPDSNQYNLVGQRGLGESALNQIDISANVKAWNSELKSVISEWSKITGNRQSIIADIGWNDTIQILLGEVLKESGKKADLSGLYLGRTGTNIFHPDIYSDSSGVIFNSLHSKPSKYLYQPAVWESFLNSDNVGNPTRENIILGINQIIDYYHSSDITTQDLWQYNRPTLLRVLKRPPRRLIEVLASLNFDYGTSDEPICPLVNTTSSPIKSWKWLLTNRSKFKSFYFHQGWKWGAASYYHFRIPYRIWRFKTKKSSF
jgi:FMN phosphatase YigB (HAD superfamily)